MRYFIEPALSEVVSHFASVDAILGGIHAEDFTKKLEGSFAVPVKVREDLANIKVP